MQNDFNIALLERSKVPSEERDGLTFGCLSDVFDWHSDFDLEAYYEEAYELLDELGFEEGTEQYELVDFTAHIISLAANIDDVKSAAEAEQRALRQQMSQLDANDPRREMYQSLIESVGAVCEARINSISADISGLESQIN